MEKKELAKIEIIDGYRLIEKGNEILVLFTSKYTWDDCISTCKELTKSTGITHRLPNICEL